MGAFAATTNSALQVKAVGTKTTEFAGNLRIAETTATVGSISSGDTITFSLLNGAKFATPGAVNGTVFSQNGTAFGAGAAVVTGDNSVTLTVGAGPGGTTARTIDFNLSGLALDLSSLNSSDVVVDVYSPNGGVTNGTVTVATVASGSTSATVLSTKTFSKGKTNQAAGTIRIIESKADALSVGDAIKVSIPTADVKFNAGQTVTATVTNPTVGLRLAAANTGAGAVTATPAAPTTNADGYSEFVFYVRAVSAGSPAVIEITGMTVDVDTDASEGDVQVKVAGDATSQTMILGTSKTYGYTTSVESVIEVMAGDDTETLKDIFIKENIEATIIGNGRTIKFELPANTAWVSAPTIEVVKGAGLTLAPAATVFSTDRRTVTYEFTAGDFSTSAYNYKFKDGKIAVKATAAAGDVVMKIAGSSNVTGELKIAEIVSPVTITAQKADVQVGKQAQAIGDILIKETKAGYLKAVAPYNTIVIDLGATPAGTFAATPKVEVVEGDLKIDKLTKTSSQITITLDRVSTTPSTIKISGVTVDLDRTPAEGDYKLRVYGGAINRVFANYGNAAGSIGHSSALDIASTNGPTFVGMTVVTPAQDGVVKPVLMTVGSTVYTIDGVEMTMDVAPYIKDSRTYFPVRYVAQALGITADNVVWDGAQRTVTIFRGNRIVQVTIGSTTMLVNGVPLTMDAAPEITAERTMLPIRFVAQGLGVNVNWDAATQTVTLN